MYSFGAHFLRKNSPCPANAWIFLMSSSAFRRPALVDLLVELVELVLLVLQRLLHLAEVRELVVGGRIERDRDRDADAEPVVPGFPFELLEVERRHGSPLDLLRRFGRLRGSRVRLRAVNIREAEVRLEAVERRARRAAARREFDFGSVSYTHLTLP